MPDRPTLAYNRLVKLTDGLIRTTESDYPITPLVSPATTPLDAPGPVLRASGFFRPAEAVDLETVLEPVREASAPLRDALASVSDVQFEWLGHPKHTWSPVLTVTAQTAGGFIALIPRIEVAVDEFAPAHWVSAPNASTAPESRDIVDRFTRATNQLFLVEAFRPSEPAWSVAAGETRRSALENAACAAGLVRKKPFSPLRLRGDRYPPYEPLNKHLSLLQDVAIWYLGWRAIYAEVMVGRNKHGLWTGVLTHVVWT